jgi:phosphopantetheinyl transferase
VRASRNPQLERGSDERAAVLALWSAKEALLKLVGVGLAGLARCALVRREGDFFRLAHGETEHEVRVLKAGKHVVAYASASPAELVLRTLEPVA